MTAPYTPSRRALTLKALAAGTHDGEPAIYYSPYDTEPKLIRIDTMADDGTLVTTTSPRRDPLFIPVADLVARRVALRPARRHVPRFSRGFGLVAWCARCDWQTGPHPSEDAAGEAFRAEHTDAGTEADR